jgi:hypothetical protein
MIDHVHAPVPFPFSLLLVPPIDSLPFVLMSHNYYDYNNYYYQLNRILVLILDEALS